MVLSRIRSSLKVTEHGGNGIREGEYTEKERWKNNSKFVMCIASSIYEARNRPDGWG